MAEAYNERALEEQIVFEAELAGWDSVKAELLNGGRRGGPDRMFWRKGRVVFIEFKHPAGTGRLHAKQRRFIERLRKGGIEVHVVSDADVARRILGLCGDT